MHNTRIILLVFTGIQKSGLKVTKAMWHFWLQRIDLVGQSIKEIQVALHNLNFENFFRKRQVPANQGSTTKKDWLLKFLFQH